MTSSTKPEVHNVHCNAARTGPSHGHISACAKTLTKPGRVIFVLCERTDRQTNRQTHRSILPTTPGVGSNDRLFQTRSSQLISSLVLNPAQQKQRFIRNTAIGQNKQKLQPNLEVYRNGEGAIFMHVALVEFDLVQSRRCERDFKSVCITLRISSQRAVKLPVGRGCDQSYETPRLYISF